MISVVKDDGKSIVYAKSTDDRDDALAAVTDKNDVVIFREMDTGKDYVYNDGDWYEYTEEGGGGGGGGGGGSAQKKQINFIDYDGTILHSYTAEEFSSVTELPANPSHEGLVAQGWNWTKAEITAQLTAVPGGDVWVGQMYITESGDTEIDVTFDDPDYLSPYLCININGTVTVDWGDGSASDTLTGSNMIHKQHTYASTGNYTIKLTVEDGTFAFYVNTNSYSSVLVTTSKDDNRKINNTYSNCIKAIWIGENAQIGNNAFNNCSSLISLTIPNSVTSIEGYAFNNCRSLTSLTIPSGVTRFKSYTFNNCYSLASLAIPSSVTNIEGYMFSGCYLLKSLTIPSGVTSILGSLFYSCASLTSLTIPSSVTSIGNAAFSSCRSLTSLTIPSNVTSIGNSVFNGCTALTSLTIPSSVTSIGNSVFGNCQSIEEYHFEATTPPTLGTTAFSGIVSGTIIYVPAASLEAYQTAENWSTYASYMQGE